MRTNKLVTGTLAGALALSLVGCGTLLHPERKGQSAGKLDPSVVILDGIGLFFFLIPGLVAFAVDFGNGTIYLPGGGAGAGDASGDGRGSGDGEPAGDGWRRLAAGGPIDAAAIDRIVRRETGVAAVSGRDALVVRRASPAQALALSATD